MSKNSVNCATSVGTEVKFAGNDSKSKMYEPKHKKKLVRVLTVIAYIFSVSLAAITLSLFYLFIYNPGKPGHSVGSSNGTANGRFYARSNEGFVIVNNTYSTYEREEPRALPLEIIQEQTQSQTKVDVRDNKPKKFASDGVESGDGKSSFFTRIARTLEVYLVNTHLCLHFFASCETERGPTEEFTSVMSKPFRSTTTTGPIPYPTAISSSVGIYEWMSPQPGGMEPPQLFPSYCHPEHPNLSWLDSGQLRLEPFKGYSVSITLCCQNQHEVEEI